MKAKSVIRTRTARKPVVTPVRRQVKTATVLKLPVQPALQVGSVSDPAEREAETMAARVVGASAPTQAAPAANGDGRPPASSGLTPLRRSTENQPNLDELQPEPPGAEQQDFDLPKEQDVTPEGLDASDMSELESGKPVDTGGDGDVAALRRDSGPKAAVGRMGGKAPGDVSALVANPGPGRPLPSGLRARVEPHFNRDFSDVRLHDAPADQKAAARIGARAFTHKNRIWLGKGESPTNTRLMAHELTHVVQQTDGAERLPIHREEVQREPIRREEDEGYIAGKLEGYARYVPGYTLATIILGKTLISGRKVAKTAENLLGGLFGLHPLGTVLFDKLRETKMVQEAYDWTVQRLSDLNLTWSRVTGIIDKIWDAPWTGTMDYIKGLFRPIVNDLITFAKDVGLKVLEFAVRGALKLAGPYADKVWGIIQQAKEVINLIIEDPLQFAKNLIKAIVGGFGRFATNILEHLKKGLLGWLFGAVADAGITLPEKFDFKGLMSLVMQILGLTYANFRKQLVKKLGPSGERKVAMIEKSVEIVKILLKEGFAGIWKKMLEMIENFKSTLIGGISTMVITTIVKAGLSWLAGLSNPIGGVVKVVLGIYDMIVAFLERLEQIMAVAQSIFSSVGAIARGQTESAAKFVEETIGRTVPVVIAFLAAALGLGGISSKIKGVIKKLQAPVTKAMGKLIGFVIKKMKKLFSKIIAKLNKKRKLPSGKFKIGNTAHEIVAEKDGKKVKYMIHSEEGTKEDADDDQARELNEAETELAKGPLKRVATAMNAVNTRLEDDENINANAEDKNNQRVVKKAQKEIDGLTPTLNQAGADGDKTRGTTSKQEKGNSAVLRAVQPREIKFEGIAGTYDDVGKIKDAVFADDKETRKLYQIDHTIEKQFPKLILESLHLIDGAISRKDRKEAKTPALRKNTKQGIEGRKGRNERLHGKSDMKARAASDSVKPFGQLGTTHTVIDEVGKDLPAISVYHINHNTKKEGLSGHPPETMVDVAKNAKDPRGKLRKLLSNQLRAEYSDMLSRLKKDPNAPAGAAAQMETELAKIMTINQDLFGLQNVEPPVVPDDQEPSDATVFYLGGNEAALAAGKKNGDKAAPNFAKWEGTGRHYKDRKEIGPIAGFLENDHVLDKEFPKSIAKLPILNDDQKTRLRAAVAAIAPSPNATQTKRLSWLTGSKARMYQKGTSIGSYEDDDGYSIAIYKPLADRVTGSLNNNVNFEGHLKSAPSSVISSLAEFVTEGDRTAAKAHYTSAMRSLHGIFEKTMTRRTELHASKISSEYEAETATVIEANPEPAARAEAIKTMRTIKGRVATHLVTARTETTNLFDGGNVKAPPV